MPHTCIFDDHRPIAWVVTSEIYPLTIRGMYVQYMTMQMYIYQCMYTIRTMYTHCTAFMSIIIHMTGYTCVHVVWQIHDMIDVHCISNITGIAVSITTTANWTGNFIIALSTPILLNSSLQTHGTFYILAALLFLATTFVLFTLPETKVKPALYIQYIGQTCSHVTSQTALDITISFLY